ncbi:tyrosine-type recombinase/integrase [Limosilactobacillus fermentum]|uniref:tyrosine-type recombinase/integrase n=1 Tax=Limosilactobacillus fermentum TaxID=1613 RepID=UPI001402D74A|nr:site-specific integrase [Limosilactobacillus fermentum]
MAYYQKRGKTWQARISWVDVQGERHTKSKGGFSTKAAAKLWGFENENRLRQGVNIGKAISFYDYFCRWVETYKEGQVSHVSLVRYQTTENDIKSFFGNTQIKDVTRSKYQSFINHFGADHAPSTVQKINGFIRACVKSAILDDYLLKDFTQGVSLTSNKEKIKNVEYLNLEEIQKLTKWLAANLNPNFTSRYMILTAIYTGMRLSEIQGLTWKDVNFLHQKITINKSWDAVNKKFKDTKNQSSKRTIKVNPELLAYLVQLHSRNNSTMVFMNCYGDIPTSGAVNKSLRTALEALKFKKQGFHFHSLRHSHVALLLSQGIDLYAISKRLGHSNMTTTSNTYAYLIDEYKDKTDEQIVEALKTL